MRAWAEIDLDALTHNIHEIRRATHPGARIMAVVKADGYGHGFNEVVKTAAENGVDAFAVATVEEGVQMRRAGFYQDVMILGGITDEEISEAIEYDIILAVYEFHLAASISKAAKRLGKTARIHIKLDTGMSRIGFVAGVDDEAVCREILQIAALENIIIDGIFSHFSTADESDRSYTDLQFQRFLGVCELLEKKGLHIPTKHIANSAAIMMYPDYHLDMVRAGVILYGLYPSHEVDRSRLNLKPVMTLKSKITYIKDLVPGRGVSYGKEYITEETRRIATVSIGYADGFIRSFSRNGFVLVHEKKVPIVGRICMDQCMIDVTNVHNINTGDEVILFTDHAITADTLAERADTINYEIICMVSKRIPRIYLKDGKAVKELNFLLES